MNPIEVVWWALALGTVILIAAVCLVVTVAAIRSVKTKPNREKITPIVGGGRRD